MIPRIGVHNVVHIRNALYGIDEIRDQSPGARK